MKNFNLMELNIRNFKGIEKFSLNADGKDIMALGRNATGKTTLFDGFTWLLFGKDSLNRSNFEIKTLDENGSVKQHGIEHEVEGIFQLDGSTITLKRVYKEEWTKKRGSSKKTFTGHTTDYYINDLPVKKKEYEETISKIVSEDVFRLLTNPLYFNEHLDRTKRREILLNIVGDISDREVARNSQNRELITLVDRLLDRDIEKYQKMIRTKQREINKKLDMIPVRIDEIQLNLPNVEGLNEAELKKQLESFKNDIEEKQGVIYNIRSGGQVSELRKQISDIEMEITQIKNNHNQDSQQEIFKLEVSIQEMESNVSLLQSKCKTQHELIAINQRQIKGLQETVARLREEWAEVDNQIFEHTSECECPTCGQSLPEEQIEAAREQAEKVFNEKKANHLETIVEQGKRENARIEELKEIIEREQRKKEKYQEEIESSADKAERLKATLKKLKENITDITENAEYVKKMEEKKRIEQQIDEISVSTQDSINSIQDEIHQLTIKHNDTQDRLNEVVVAQRSNKRMKELVEQEKELTTEYEQLEKELFLTEEFTRAKVNLLEEKINRKFKHAKFKLFEEQINGGLKETCETLYEGVPYNGGLNNAARINVGLDIINTLNEHYGIYVPIFIDNRESVIELIDIEAQTISLVVSEKAHQLEVVYYDEKAV